MGTVPMITLNDGRGIPQLGFGTFKIDPSETTAAVLVALELGYRHVDTAQMYGNEREVGRAVRDSGLPREDVFVTSKLNNGNHERGKALRAFDETMAELDLEYLDLFLIHWPLPRRGRYVEAWEALIEMQESGRVRSIGVSNFHPEHLQRLLDETAVVPAVNQIEVQPYLTQEPLRAFNAEHGIATEAWSPLARGKVADDPVIRDIAAQTSRTPAQVTLRWHLQRGDIVFPKSVRRERMAENIALFDFELSAAQMAAISALNRDARTGANPATFHWIP